MQTGVSQASAPAPPVAGEAGGLLRWGWQMARALQDIGLYPWLDALVGHDGTITPQA